MERAGTERMNRNRPYRAAKRRSHTYLGQHVTFMALRRTLRMEKQTMEKGVPRSIDGKGRTIRELLSAKRYSIDYYQREYKWETKQVGELIDDLTSKFLESF